MSLPPPPPGKRIPLKPVTVLDLVVLLDHVLRGADDREVGHEDAANTLDRIIYTLNRRHMVPADVLESALWSCNLLREKDQFRHPLGYTFDYWLAKLLKGEQFDKTYNFIKDET